jgi:hypothetical protein
MITEWLHANKLSLNTEKNKYMIFHTPQKNISNIKLKLKLYDNPIQQVQEFNFLGLVVHECLNWNSHISNISNKISKNLGILNKLKRFLPRYILITMYNSLILPHIYYGILVWGHSCPRVIKLQKRALRIIINSKYNAHCEPILKLLNLLSVDDIHTAQCLKFYHKYVNGNLPAYFHDMYTANSSFHNYNTRNRHNITLPYSRTSFAQQSIRFKVPAILQRTPAIVSDKIISHSLQGFSTYCKSYLISKYSSECNLTNCYVCGHH